MPHAPAVPIDAVACVVVGRRTIREVEQRSCVAGENGLDVRERRRVAQAANFLAKRPQRFGRDLPHAQHPAVAQFPDRRSRIGIERVVLQRRAQRPASRAATNASECAVA